MNMNVFDEARVWHVTAGPGCGKSHFIAQTIDSLLAQDVKPTEIMYLLYNRKPAMAFRSRYLDMYLPEDLRWWGTHHSIAYRLMKLSPSRVLDMPTWGKENGFDLSEEIELRERGLDEYGWDSVFGSLSKKIYMDERDFTKEEQRLLDALKATEEREGKFCHVRYLEKALRLDMFPVGIKYVFLDEAQDNGKLQLDWLKRIIARGDVAGIMLAGDDKQAINRFKGGQSDLFLDFPADRYVNLSCTYRLPREVLKEANGIISPVAKRSQVTTETAVAYPGRVVATNDLRDCIYDISKALKMGKSVMVLCRNRCYIRYISAVLTDNDIPIETEWVPRLKRILSALLRIRADQGLREETLAAILPSHGRQKTGELRRESYWRQGYADKLRSGDVIGEPQLFQGYEALRLGRVLPLAESCVLGFTDDFIRDLTAWEIPDSKWNLEPEKLHAFKRHVQSYGPDFGVVRTDTIHAVKGEEADMVILVGNITGRTERSEDEDEDEERRVWYVGASRARETLMLTKLSFSDKVTKIL